MQNINSQLSEKVYLNELVALVKGSQYERQDYVNIVQSSSHRTMYARIRTNATGLSRSPYCNVTKLCDECDEIRDFKHLLLKCKSSEVRRVKFYDKIKDIYPDFKSKSIIVQYREIMNLNFNGLDDCNRDSMISFTLAFVDTIYKSLV